MNCNEAQDLLFDFYNNSVSSKEKIEIARHLSKCNLCKKELSEVIKLSRLSKQLDDVPEDIFKTAFIKIPNRENKLQLSVVWNELYYSIKIAKQAVNLAMQII